MFNSFINSKMFAILLKLLGQSVIQESEVFDAGLSGYEHQINKI
jgi:hypothetical protein